MLQRAVVMISPEQRDKLEELANAAHVSAAEINRRAIDAYDPALENIEELEKLLDMLAVSNQQAIQSIDRANEVVQETLEALKGIK